MTPLATSAPYTSGERVKRNAGSQKKLGTKNFLGEKNMDSIYILQYGNGDGIISVHYDEDDANEALHDITSEPGFADATIEQWEVN